ncbi:Nitric oxide reductase, cytochrome b [Candidatus Zixiibacteriota bacterium]|nr:Nitric oxide reductase, cytochrome b [candidate division Zixibacteria bacterium]
MSFLPTWRNSVIAIIIIMLSVLIWISVRSYSDAPPIPDRVLDPDNKVVFNKDDIQGGQSVFLKYGLMENGSIWGHGAYLGPDFSAQYLHNLYNNAAVAVSQEKFGRPPGELTPEERDIVTAEVSRLLKTNRYDSRTGILSFTGAETSSFQHQQKFWREYFENSSTDRGLTTGLLNDSAEIRQLVAFFAWTAWASAANRPGEDYSYTNNFPYDPLIGNGPSSSSYIWSALSLITLLAGIGAVLFIFGRFNFLGWKGQGEHIHPQLIPGGESFPSQKATIKFFSIAAFLFLLQALMGGATAHYRVDPGNFYGFDLSAIFPSNIARTWHLQLAIFWIATTYVAGALFLAPTLGRRDASRQTRGINWLFAGLVIVVLGSLLGEILGINRLLGTVWFWFGHQGWEYLDLGRAWQIMLAVALVGWLYLLLRNIAPSLKNPESKEVGYIFLFSALAIPVFYLPAMFFTSTTHFTVVDTWRFWIIHLWVEGFFELFVTAMVAIIFLKLGMTSTKTTLRVIYLDAILYLGSGIVGTGHHWYWTGQSNITMALAAMFSAMEVVPLTLLTLDAWDFVKLTRSKCDICGRIVAIPHKWCFYFLMAVGFWNFVGAGVFGFLINLPIVSYFEVGTILTPNHGHAAMMGVFGMLGIGLMLFAFRQVLPDDRWAPLEKYVRLSFWGLNIGLALMVVTNLFPGGVLQLRDVILNGYWHARSTIFLDSQLMRTLEWLRLPGDLIFIGLGILPLCFVAAKTYLLVRKNRQFQMPKAQ